MRRSLGWLVAAGRGAGEGTGSQAGAAGRGHPRLIWRKPAICWAREVPPPGKWNFRGRCLPASSFLGEASRP